MRRDGRRIDISLNISPMRDASGHIIGAAKIARDITERKRAEEALRASEQSLRELSQSLEERVAERTAQVRDLAASRARAEQEERKRIAQLLHDHVQQILYSIQMQMHLLKMDIPDPELETVKHHLENLTEMVQSALHAIRSLAVELSPPILDNKSLSEAVHWLAGHMEGVHGLAVTVETEGDCRVADRNKRTLLFQVLRELLFNVVKHAAIDRASVHLRCDGPILTAVVSDKGRGFAPATLSTRQASPTGFGLAGMSERLSLFGGAIHLQSEPGKGAEVTVTLPLGEIG
jgi:signal transduction histidine kinase